MKVGKKEKKERIIYIYFGYLMEPIVKMWKFEFFIIFFNKKFGNSRNSFACIKIIFFRAKK
jgi:hypothetical protein